MSIFVMPAVRWGSPSARPGANSQRDEADAFISRLQDDELGQPDTPAPRSRPARSTPAPYTPSLVRVPTDQLAAELRRRGWVVTEP